MIDKTPETTTLNCQLPKESVDRLVTLAERRNLTLDEAIHQAIDQSCERWVLEETCGPAEVYYSAPTIPRKKGTPIEVTRVAPRLPDPIVVDECDSIPVELPGSPTTPIKVTRVVKEWPERLHDET